MGCAPPAVMIASQATDGVSYLTTGKSTTDHLLSTALDEDCALHRVISGVAVCQDDQHKPVQTASLADTPVIGDDAAEAGDGDTMPVQQASAPVEQQAVAGHGAPRRSRGSGPTCSSCPTTMATRRQPSAMPRTRRAAAPAARPDDGAAPPAPPPIPDAAAPNGYRRGDTGSRAHDHDRDRDGVAGRAALLHRARQFRAQGLCRACGARALPAPMAPAWSR